MLVVRQEARDGTDRPLTARGGEVAQLEQQGLGVDVGKASDPPCCVPLAQDPQHPGRRRARLGHPADVIADAADADHDRQATPDPLAELLRQAGGAFLGLAAGHDGEQAVRDAADHGDGRVGHGCRQVHAERVGNAPEVAGSTAALTGGLGGAARQAARVLGAQGRSEHDDLLAGQAEPAQRVARADTALQRGAHQVGAQPALHVGAGAHPQQVQGDQLGGVLQRLRSARA